MAFIIIFLIIYFLSISISEIFNKKIDMTIPIAVLVMVIVVYIFGIFEKLSYGVLAVKFILIVSTIFVIYRIIVRIKNKTIKKFLSNIVTPGLVIYILFIIINILLNKNRLLEFYDNFNHWALIVRNMYLFDGYGTVENSIVMFNEYPPFTATFQYIALSINGQYAEDIIIMAQNVLYFSMIMPLFSKVNWKNGKKKLIFLLPIVIFMPLIFYSNFYAEILVDGFIGILFSMGIYAIVENNSNKIYKYTIIGTYVLAVSLTKNIGIIFGILILVLELINIIIEKVKKKLSIKKDIIGIISIILAIIVLVGGWYFIISINNSELMWDNNKQKQIDESYKQNVFKSFVNEIYMGSKDITVQNLSVLSLFVMYITYSIFIYIKLKNRVKAKYRLKTSLIIMVIAIIGYILGMLYAYIYLFKTDETAILASFNRYISTILLSAFWLNTVILVDSIEWKNYYICVLLMILLIFLPLEKINNTYIKLHKYNIYVMSKRSEYGKISKYRTVLNENDVIYFISNKIDSLYATALSKYEMMPIKLIGIDEINYEKIEEEIEKNKITYIYILNENISLENKIENVFELKQKLEEDSLYKINNTKDGVRLEKVKLK